jgi:hypothetical protein
MDLVIIIVLGLAACAAVAVPFFRRHHVELLADPAAAPGVDAQPPNPTALAELEEEIAHYRTALRAGTICDRCGRANREASRFCAECGRPLRRRGAEASS